jgi:hypothetical protein
MKTKIYNSLIKFSFTVMMLFLFMTVRSQSWIYDFGQGVGEWATASGTNTTLLPHPVAGGGNDMLSIGAVAQGSGFYLQNPGLPLLGSGSELKATASTGIAVNKFSIHGYTPSKLLHTKFTVLFGDPSGEAGPKAGDWYYFQGAGALYSNTSNASTNLNQSFISLRWTFAPGNILRMAYHNGVSWIDLTSLAGYPLQQKKIYQFEFFGNNDAVASDYYHNGNLYTLAADRWDLWLDGVRIFQGLISGGMANNVNIDSWLFAGEHSTTNFATIFLDDMAYSNLLPSNPLPIELVDFTARSTSEGVVLEWKTASEDQNDYFGLEYSTDATDFSTVYQMAGAGYSNSPITYQYLHSGIPDGNLYYRLKQTDFNGAFTYSPVISVRHTGSEEEWGISSPYAGGDQVAFSFGGPEGEYLIEIIGLDGRRIYTSNVIITSGERVTLPASLPSQALFLLSVSNGKHQEAIKFFAL